MTLARYYSASKILIIRDHVINNKNMGTRPNKLRLSATSDVTTHDHPSPTSSWRLTLRTTFMITGCWPVNLLFLEVLHRKIVELVLSTRYAISRPRRTALEHSSSIDYWFRHQIAPQVLDRIIEVFQWWISPFASSVTTTTQAAKTTTHIPGMWLLSPAEHSLYTEPGGIRSLPELRRFWR